MKLLINLFLFCVSAVVLLAVIAAATVMLLPDVHVLEGCIDTNMYHVHLCPESPDYVQLNDISPFMLHAVIAAEDGSFYSHEGFDWHEMEESLNADLQSGHIRRGGSTLTQQLAKNVFLDKEKSLWRKLKEAYLAHAIEKHYTKNFILEKYLNVVEFGPELYGIKPAAKHYFHKEPRDLNPLESAYLAFLLPNPKGYSKSFRASKLTPFGHRMVATILKRMTSYGKLSPGAYQTAMGAMDSFPWTGLTSESFRDVPTYNLDAEPQDAKAAAANSDPMVEEINKEESNDPETSAASEDTD
jgi:monofunctional biosynthetic peptidoglycan transglycosylase